MNDSNRQSLPANYPSGPPPLNHSFGSATTVDSWMTTAPSAGQPLPSYATLANQNEFSYGSAGPPPSNGPNFMHHSYIQQQPYLNNKYPNSGPDSYQNHNQSHNQFNSNLYNNYANNYVSKVDISSKPTANNTDANSDSHMEVCQSEGNAAEGLTARLLDKNSDGTPVPHSPSSQDSGSNSVGYRPWEQPGADGQALAQEQTNAQQMQTHPTRPSSAQSDKAQTSHPQRTTPDTARRTGRSPSAQQFGDNHNHEKYQTLTPVPPIPPLSVAYNTNHMYGQPPTVIYPNPLGAPPYMQTQFAGYPTPDGKPLKMGIAEPDSSTPDVRHGGLDNTFQVPSVSSTTPRPVIGGIPQPSATPPHPQQAQQIVSIQTSVVGEQWETNQVPVPQNITQQTAAEGEKVTKKKRKRCGECPGCLKKDNCGECGPCKSVRSHQICKMRKCDQLKTKKEKVREAAQLAAAAAASGITLGKDLSALENTSRNMNGTNISAPFANMGPNDASGVGPTPRGQYSDFSAPKHPANINQVYESNAQTFTNFHMNSPQIAGPYNGHGLVSDVNRSHHSPEDSSVNSDNTHINRHQMMNNRLKSLIQSRQTQKEMNNGQQNHNSFGSGPQPTQQQQQQPFAGQTFIVVQQQSNANNTSLSPHYGQTSVPPNADTGQSFANMNWSQSEPPPQEDYHKINGIGDKLGVPGGRRTPYNSIDLPNGSVYHTFNESQTNANTINNNNINNNNTNNTNSNNNKPNAKTNQTSNTNSSFAPTTTYSTNQSQSFASQPNQDYSPHETLPNSMPGRQTQTPSSRSSPARAVTNSSANSGNKTMESEAMVTMVNGVNPSQPHLNNEQNLENEPFLVNTTTTMHHNLSDLTTSMNTSTGIISSYSLSPHSQSSAYYPSSLYMPSLGVLGPSSPTVIMSVSGVESGKKSLEEPQTSVGHSISGIDCGRIIDPLDTSSLNLMDVSSMTSFIKSDPNCDPLSTSSSPLLLSSETNNTFSTFSTLTTLSGVGTTTTTVLPPVSTFLLPSFRDQWWDRNLDRLKTNTKDANDCECYAPDEREYSRTTSPSTLTTLPASLSN